ncbi:MAG: response regulator transcription factor [Saprospiraceae bacterium]|nr:response regulator transcription factor [Saprospiraceae bacterium]
MKVLIIEDEQPAAKQLTKLLKKIAPSVSVIETLDSVESSVKWLKTFPAPDAVFMDIQIADGLSFDIFSQADIQSPVVFTTAFDQYAVKAFKVNAIDYLLKPIDEDELSETLLKLQARKLELITPPQYSADFFKNFYQNTAKQVYKERFLIKTGHNLTSVETQDIAYFFSEDGLTQCFTFQNRKHVVESTLDELENNLNPKDFFRINRKIVLHVKAIQKISPHFNGRLKLELTPQYREDIFVARERVNDFKAWLGG